MADKPLIRVVDKLEYMSLAAQHGEEGRSLRKHCAYLMLGMLCGGACGLERGVGTHPLCGLRCDVEKCHDVACAIANGTQRKREPGEISGTAGPLHDEA